jgi:hypothetical protein
MRVVVMCSSFVIVVAFPGQDKKVVTEPQWRRGNAVVA